MWRRSFQFIFVLLLLLVLGLSLAPMSHPTFSPNDKVNHLLAYATLMCVGYWGMAKPYTIIALVFAWGVLIEVLQGMTEYRVFSGYDVMANSIGILFGCVMVFVVNRCLNRSSILKNRRT